MIKSRKRRLFNVTANRLVAPWLGIRLRRMADPPQVLFILSHARSGSTLLQHLLCSHPALLGYGENKVSYTTEVDRTRLMARTAMIMRSFGLHERFFVDKFVWNYEISDGFLQSEGCRFIFLLRTPGPTLASMARVGDFWKMEANASGAYVKQLAYLADTAKRIHSPRRAFFLTYEQLVDQTGAALAALGGFLELDEPLSERYDLLPTTGRFEYGDKSDNIKSGKIMARSSVLSDGMPVPDAAQEAYGRCSAVLGGTCATVG